MVKAGNAGEETQEQLSEKKDTIVMDSGGLSKSSELLLARRSLICFPLTTINPLLAFPFFDSRQETQIAIAF